MKVGQTLPGTMRYFSMSRQINKEKRHYNKIVALWQVRRTMEDSD